MKYSTEDPLSADQMVSSKEFSEFYATAIDFCSFIEEADAKSCNEFLVAVQIRLLNLYKCGLRLQRVELKSRLDDDLDIDRSSFDNIVSLINSKLESSLYWHIFDPTDVTDTEAVCGDLGDDLGDIYIDLKRNMYIYEKLDNKERALWQFKFDFDFHWSDHCINALMAIHFFLQE